MSVKNAEPWRYYLSEDGPDGAQEIKTYEWQKIFDAEDAAALASENEWDAGGSEAGVGDGPVIVVISPDGTETRFQTTRQIEISHSVTELEPENEPL